MGSASSSSLNPLSPSFLIPLFIVVMIGIFIYMTRREKRKNDAILGSTETPEQILARYQQQAKKEASH